MGKKLPKKIKSDTDNLFEQGKKVEQRNEVKEANVAYAPSIEIGNTINDDFERRNSIQNQVNNSSVKSNYLANSINFLSFLAHSFDMTNLKIISSAEICFIMSALKKVYKEKATDILQGKYFSNFQNDGDDKELGFIFFNLIVENDFDKNLSAYTKKINNLLKKLLLGMEEVKKGKRSIEVVLAILNKNKETKKFIELSKFLGEYKSDEFSQLNDIAEKIIAFLNETKTDDKYLNSWKTAIWAFLWVLRYSTQSIEMLIDDLLKKKNSQFKELHIVLIGLFATKLFHSSPSWKPIGLSYQLYEKMKVLQPAAEVFYNPNIITSLSSDPKKQEEYFWTYVWGKPYSIFENATKKEVKKYQKKLIEVEEEIIVEENTFGNFITISGEPKPTGIIHIKTKI